MVKKFRRMITDFLKNNHAYLKCLECGAEHMILHYEMTEHYSFPVINHKKTIECIEAFQAKHALCKVPGKQLMIIDGQL